MPVAKLTVTLPTDLLRRVDQARSGRRRRSDVIHDALRQYLGHIPEDEATSEEIDALERGRRQIALGEHVTLEEALDGLGLDSGTGRRKGTRPSAAQGS